MKVRDLSEEVVMGAIQAFYDDMSQFLNSVTKTVGNQVYSIPRTPRRLGIAEFPYFYAVDLYEIFSFARGRQQMSASYVEKKCEELLALLHTTPTGQRVEPNWPELASTALGCAILSCGARIALRRDEGTMSREEIEVLSAWNAKQLERAELQVVETEEGPRYRSEDVRRAFKAQGIAV